MKLFTTFVLVLLACSCSTAQNVYCGRRLAMALAMLCEQSADKRAGGQYADYWLPWQHAHSRTDSNTGSWPPHAHIQSDSITESWPLEHTNNELVSWSPHAHSRTESGTGSWEPHAHSHSKSETGPWLPESEATPWVSASRARAIGRGKRQVVMECCMKPCSEDELMSYC